eukprot:scaffold2646_cov184-Ochromonas_danica.AAC.9
MPDLDSDDEEELIRIMNSSRENRLPPTPKKIKPPQPLVAPNREWRSALETPYRPTMPIRETTKRRPPVSPPSSYYDSDSDDDIDDFDYEDFEEALREVEREGQMPGKYSSIMEDDHPGLQPGEIISPDLWGSIVDYNGTATNLRLIHKDVKDIIVVFVDPRRGTADYETVLQDFDYLHRTQPKVAFVAVNCDDNIDLRKRCKKFPRSYPVLIDPTEKFVEAFRCYEEGRLEFCLAMLDARSGLVLRSWYEKSFRSVSTRRILEEEFKQFRANRSQFLQKGMGFR